MKDSKDHNNNTNNHKPIRISVTEEQHKYLTDQASKMKYSIGQYAKLKTLDDTIGMEERRRKIFQIMPQFYNLVAEIEDSNTRQALKELGGKICLFLK